MSYGHHHNQRMCGAQPLERLSGVPLKHVGTGNERYVCHGEGNGFAWRGSAAARSATGNVSTQPFSRWSGKGRSSGWDR